MIAMIAGILLALIENRKDWSKNPKPPVRAGGLFFIKE